MFLFRWGATLWCRSEWVIASWRGSQHAWPYFYKSVMLALVSEKQYLITRLCWLTWKVFGAVQWYPFWRSRVVCRLEISVFCASGDTSCCFGRSLCSFVRHSRHQQPYEVNKNFFKVWRTYGDGENVLQLEANGTSVTRAGDGTGVSLFWLHDQSVPSALTSLFFELWFCCRPFLLELLWYGRRYFVADRVLLRQYLVTRTWLRRQTY